MHIYMKRQTIRSAVSLCHLRIHVFGFCNIHFNSAIQLPAFWNVVRKFRILPAMAFYRNITETFGSDQSVSATLFVRRSLSV